MKKLSILMAALLVAMTGCQKEPQVETQGNDADHYVAVNINLPRTMGTKANDNYANGLDEEFKVNDITLVFYTETGTYVEHAKNVANSWGSENTDGNQITISGKTAAVKVSSGSIKKVLVLVNSTNVAESNYKDLSFSAFQEKVLEGADLTGDGFFMCNAPAYKTSAFETLADVTVQSTETDALNSPATVNVERAVAKVQVDFGTNDFNVNTYYPVGGNFSKVTFAKWALNTVNTKTYAVRNYDEVGGTSWWNAGLWVNNSLSGSDRLYFSVDPNYDGTGVPADFTKLTTDPDQDDDAYVYCYENTFDINNMKENQTTAVVLMGTFTPANFNAGDTWYMVGAAKEPKTETELIAAFTSAGVSVTAGDLVWNKNVLDWTNPAYSAAEGAIGNVVRYENGVCYYPVLIRHFTYDELGYASEEAFMTNFETNDGYVNEDLGRYGVVRNNWYKLTVNSVSEPGSPVIPEPGTGDDDKITRYCACTIDILAWNLRNQTVDL